MDIVLQESVGTESAPQAIELIGTASADGARMSDTYQAFAGSCKSGDYGTWQENKN